MTTANRFGSAYVLHTQLDHWFGQFGAALPSSDLSRLYLTNWFDAIKVVNMEQIAIEATLTDFSFPAKLLTSEDDSFLYVSHQGGISAVDTATWTTVVTYDYPDPSTPGSVLGMAHGATNQLHIALSSSAGIFDYIDTLDTATGEITDTLIFTGSVISLVSYDELLYVSYFENGNAWLLRYDISAGKPLSVTAVAVTAIGRLSTTSDGETLLSRTLDDRTIYQYDLPSLNFVRAYSLTSPDNFIWHGTTLDSQQLLGLYRQHHGEFSRRWAIRNYDLSTGELLRDFADPLNLVDPPLGGHVDVDQRVAVVYTDRLRLFVPADHHVALPAVFHNYCAGPFIDNFTNPDSGWPIWDTGSVIYRYLDGEYNIYHRNAQRWAAASRGDVWNQSKLLQASGRVARYEGLWGLLFAANSDWSDFYTFEIVPSTQQWFIMHFTSSNGWQPYAQGSSSAIQPGSNLNTLSISQDLGSLRFSANNTLLIIISQSSVVNRVGLVGLTAGSFTNDVDIRYNQYVFADQFCPSPSISSANSFANLLELERPEIDVLLARPYQINSDGWRSGFSE